VQSRFHGIKSSVLSLKGALGGLALGAFSRQAVAAFAEQEGAERKLADALSVVGVNSKDALERHKAFASEIQKTTVIGDEAVLKMQALGASLGKLSGTQLDQATRAAIGFSRALGIDAESAMTMVAKAAQGNFAALSRYGIVLNDSLSPQEKFNELLQIGAEKFSIAEGEAKTAAGQWAQLKNAMGDVSEQIGRTLTTAFTTVGQESQSVLQKMTSQLLDVADALTAITDAREMLARRQPASAAQSDEPGLFKMSGKKASPWLTPLTWLGQKAAERITGIPEIPPPIPGVFNPKRGQPPADRAAIEANLPPRNIDVLMPVLRALFDKLPSLEQVLDNAGAAIDQLRNTAKETLATTAQELQSMRNRSAIDVVLKDAGRETLRQRAEAGDKAARLELEKLQVEEDTNDNRKALLELLKREGLTAEQRTIIETQIADLDAAKAERIKSLSAKPTDQDRQVLSAVESRMLTRAPGAGASPEDRATRQVVQAVDKNGGEQAKALREIGDLLRELIRQSSETKVASLAG